MSFGKSKLPQHQPYEEMQDTPYITNLRDLSQKGYEGYNKNYNRVNVFDQDTQRSLNDILNNYYKRAESDFDRNYRETMNKYQNRNYGQFGTLNATPALYRTDMENLQQQRKLADLAYNKAAYYDQLMNSELQRRYNTLNMFNQMLEKGETPYQLDLANWKIRNANKDLAFKNAEINANAGGGLLGALKGALSGSAAGSIYGIPGAIIGGIGGGLTGGISQYNTGGLGAFPMTDIYDLIDMYGGYGTQRGTSGSGWNIGATLSNLFSRNQSPSAVNNAITSYMNTPTGTTYQSPSALQAALDAYINGTTVPTDLESALNAALGSSYTPVYII